MDKPLVGKEGLLPDDDDGSEREREKEEPGWLQAARKLTRESARAVVAMHAMDLGGSPRSLRRFKELVEEFAAMEGVLGADVLVKSSTAEQAERVVVVLEACSNAGKVASVWMDHFPCGFVAHGMEALQAKMCAVATRVCSDGADLCSYFDDASFADANATETWSDGVARAPRLGTLDIVDCGCDDAGVSPVAANVAKCVSLRKLSVYSCSPIDPLFGATARSGGLSWAVGQLPHLEKLALNSTCACGIVGISACAALETVSLLVAPSCLRNSSSGCDVSLAFALTRLLRSCPRLRFVRVGGCYNAATNVEPRSQELDELECVVADGVASLETLLLEMEHHDAVKRAVKRGVQRRRSSSSSVVLKWPWFSSYLDEHGETVREPQTVAWRDVLSSRGSCVLF